MVTNQKVFGLNAMNRDICTSFNRKDGIKL